jgi:hypothetical protein
MRYREVVGVFVPFFVRPLMMGGGNQTMDSEFGV